VVAAAGLQAFGSFDRPVELYGRADGAPIGDRDKRSGRPAELVRRGCVEMIVTTSLDR
jgi:hypothetical protein